MAKTIAKATGDAKAKVIAAEGEAAANTKISSSLTPILVEKMRIERWNGQLPQVQGNATPFINMSGNK